MRSFFLIAAVLAFALCVIASPIPMAEKLRAEGRSENEILKELGARHPTPSLGEADALSASLLKRSAQPEPKTMTAEEEEETKAIVNQIISNTLNGIKRSLEYLGITRNAEPEADAYEGMEYTQPNYKPRLRA